MAKPRQSQKSRPTKPRDWQIQVQALIQHGRLADADVLLANAMAANPNDPAVHHLQGVSARHAGELPRAIAFFKQAIALGLAPASYHIDLADTYFTGGRFDDAAQCYQQALAADPAAVRARYGLAMAFLAQREFAAAALQFAKLVAAEPGHAEGHLQFGAALIELARHDQAAAALNRALALRPTHAPTHLRYGVALGLQGRRDLAERHFRRALALDPALTEAADRLETLRHQTDATPQAWRAVRSITAEMMPALYKMADHAILRGRMDEASWCYERALTFHANIPAPYQGLAQLRFMQGQPEEARRHTLQAAARGADPAATQTMLGQIAEAEGNFAEAIACFEQAVALCPTEAMAQLKLALLRKSDDPAQHVANLERLRTLPTLDSRQQATLSYALARSYDQLGDADTAFAQYEAGNNGRRAYCHPYDDAAFLVDEPIEVFSRDFIQSKAAFGDPTRRPVFVVGMMRSGTTLVEQILSSHPQVHGHSELADIRRISQALPAATGGDLPYPACARLIDAGVARHFSSAYLARLERDAPEAARSIDKMPQNCHYLGLIAILFPNARIIHCARDPLDTCLSNYFHDFGLTNAHTTDLATLGGYWRKYRRLMDHWEHVLPDQILTIPYESMVADQEGWSRKAVDFIGLDWNDSCLDFHSNTRAVNTFSVWQVRQKIYSTSIGQWQRYRAHLGPLLTALGLEGR